MSQIVHVRAMVGSIPDISRLLHYSLSENAIILRQFRVVDMCIICCVVSVLGLCSGELSFKLQL